MANSVQQFVDEVFGPVFCWAKMTTVHGCDFARWQNFVHFDEILQCFRSIFCWAKKCISTALCRKGVHLDAYMVAGCAWQRVPNRWVLVELMRARSDFTFSHYLH